MNCHPDPVHRPTALLPWTLAERCFESRIAPLKYLRARAGQLFITIYHPAAAAATGKDVGGDGAVAARAFCARARRRRRRRPSEPRITLLRAELQRSSSGRMPASMVLCRRPPVLCHCSALLSSQRAIHSEMWFLSTPHSPDPRPLIPLCLPPRKWSFLTPFPRPLTD